MVEVLVYIVGIGKRGELDNDENPRK